MVNSTKIIWQAQNGPQESLIACPVFEVFFGGARGGGKTDGMLGDWLAHSDKWGEAAIGVFFRRTYKQLSEVIARSQQLFTKLNAHWNGERSEWKMPNGARLLFRYLERDSDAQNYQGHNYTRLYIEEITNFPSPAPIDKLKATLRSTIVPSHEIGFRATGNPGGPGHGWVKKRYIDPAPNGMQVLYEEFENPFTHEKLHLERVFIPSKLSDNKLLMESNPMYVAQLQQTGSKQLVQAWLLGLWDIIDGAFFSEFDPMVHILSDSILPHIPPHTTIFRAFDWGYSRPFSCGWYAIADGSWKIPRGAMVKIREWYGSTGKPNEGLRLDAGLVAEGIRAIDLELEKQWNLKTKIGFADPSIFARDGGPSIAETMMSKGVIWGRADNKRVPGWQQVRSRLRGNGNEKEIRSGDPALYFLECCDDTIRTLPLLQHDERHQEDLDTDGEDHAADELRYACMSRPFVSDATIPETLKYPKLPGQMTFDDIMALNRKKRLAHAD